MNVNKEVLEALLFNLDDKSDLDYIRNEVKEKLIFNGVAKHVARLPSNGKL